METIEYEKNISVGTLKIIPLIKTASSVIHAEAICRVSSRVVAIAFGCEDHLTEIESYNDHIGSTLFTVRSLIAIATRSQGVASMDTVHIKVHDLKSLEENIKTAKSLGVE